MTPRTEAQKENRAARRRQVAREMRLLLKRVALLSARNLHETCGGCGARYGALHAEGCVVEDTRKWLAVHKDGDGS